jgi:FK506-binding nuclear protein
MAALEPMALFGLEVPAGDVAITARGDIPAAFRITMAAIDPSAEPEGEEGAVPRATLKIIRHSLLDEDDEDDDEFDVNELERILGEADSEDDEDDEDDEDVNGGPSDPSKSKKARKAAALKEIMEAVAEDDEMDEDDDELLANGANGLKKSAKSRGKMPVDDEEEDDDEDDEDDDDEYGAEVEEFVLCTLDPTKVCYVNGVNVMLVTNHRTLSELPTSP